MSWIRAFVVRTKRWPQSGTSLTFASTATKRRFGWNDPKLSEKRLIIAEWDNFKQLTGRLILGFMPFWYLSLGWTGLVRAQPWPVVWAQVATLWRGSTHLWNKVVGGWRLGGGILDLPRSPVGPSVVRPYNSNYFRYFHYCHFHPSPPRKTTNVRGREGGGGGDIWLPI